MRIKKFAAAATGAAMLTLGGIAVAPAADAATVTPTHALELLCELKGGTHFVTPFTKARCQEAVPFGGHRGFWAERMLCERLLDGTFSAAPSFGAPKRVTWICV